MILEETINKLIRDIVNLVLSDPAFTIKAKQKDAPRPIGAYADVDLTSDTALGWEQHVLTDQPDPDVDIVETNQGLREIMMSIGFYRDAAIDNARLVRTAFVRQSVLDLLRAAGIGLIRRSEVREISEALDNGWEERAQFDIFLNAVGTDTDIIRSILSVDIAGEFQARGLSYNFNIEVM